MRQVLELKARRYRVSEGVFYKTGLPDPKGEFDKAVWLHELSMSGAFVAPRPLAWDEKTGTLETEYLEDLVPIRESYLEYLQASCPPQEGLRRFRDAGKALAVIHRGRPPRGTFRWLADPDFCSDYERWTGSSLSVDLAGVPLVPLHCDYGFSNVCVVSGNRIKAGAVSIIDPSANGFVTFQSCLIGPPHVDVANFMACIEGLVPIRRYLRAKWSRLPDLRAAFLEGYLQGGYPVDGKVLRGMTFATASAYFRRKFGSGVKKKLALLMLFNSWKGNGQRS